MSRLSELIKNNNPGTIGSSEPVSRGRSLSEIMGAETRRTNAAEDLQRHRKAQQERAINAIMTAAAQERRQKEQLRKNSLDPDSLAYQMLKDRAASGTPETGGRGGSFGADRAGTFGDRKGNLRSFMEQYAQATAMPDNPAGAAVYSMTDGYKPNRVSNVVKGSGMDYEGSVISAIGTLAQALGNAPEQQKKPETFLDHWAAAMTTANENPAVMGINQMRNNPESAKLVTEWGQSARDYGVNRSEKGQGLVQAQKEGLGTFGQTMVDVGSMGTQMALDIGIGWLTGLGMAAPMALRTFGSSAEEAAKDGADLNHQLAYAFGSAALAYGLEHISNMALSGLKVVAPGIGDDVAEAVIDKLAQKLAKTPKGATALKVVGSMLASGGGEGFEEMTESFLQPYLKKLTYDKNAQSAFEDPSQWADILYDGLLGAILGVTGYGVNTAVNTGGNTDAEENIRGAYEKYQSIFTDKAIDKAYESLKKNGMFSTKGRSDVADARENVDRYLGVKTPQSARESVLTAGNIQTQVEGEKPDTVAGVHAADSDKQVVAEKTQQERAIEAIVKAARENQQRIDAEKEAAKPKVELTQAQKNALDLTFGRKKTAAPEVDTAERNNISDLKQMQKDIEDAYAAGNMSEEEYDSALDALMEEESRAGVNTLDRYNPAMMEKTEVNDNGRSSVSDDSSQRPAGASAGEQTGELEESAGGYQSRQVQSQRARDRADAVARIYEAEQRQPVSGRFYLQSSYVEDAGQIYDVPQSVIDGDEELRTIASEAKGMGMTVHFFTGEAKLVNGRNADAMIRDNDVYIRVDGDRWTATQNWEHEKFHRVVSAAKSVVQDLFTQFATKTDGAKLHRTMEVYREAYHGICDVDENGNYVWDENAMYRVVEEILADAYAGKDTFAQGVERYTDATRDAASQIEERGVESRGPPAEAFTTNVQGQKNTAQKGGDESLYTYEYLVSKPDLKITEVPVKEIPTRGKKLDTSAIADEGRKHSGLLYDDTSLGKQRYVYIPDIDANVLLSKKGLVHGIIGNKTNGGTQNTAAITYQLPEILRNSVAVNEENPRSPADGDFNYVLFGYARRADGQEYIVKTTINHFADNKSIVDSVEIYDVLKGSKAKKVGAEVMSSHTGEPAALLSNASAPTTISVADLLEVVKKNYPEFLSDNVRAKIQIEDVAKAENLRFSAGEASSDAKVAKDPVQALPKKAQRIIEDEESKLTNALGNALRIPFKSRGEQLKGISREIINEFFRTGDVSERTMEDLFERAYRPNEQKLAEEYGVDVDEYRENAERDFKAQVGNLTAQLRLANRYAADRESSGGVGSTTVQTLEDLPKLYADMKAARRMADKAVARNLLTESDSAKVNRLLRGDIDESMLNPLTDNVNGILEVYRAKAEYEKFAREIRRWNAQRKDNLRQLADKLLETAGQWKDKSAGLLYSRETMERNVRDIVKDKKVADEVISTLFTPVHKSAAKATAMKNEYRDRVRALGLSRKVEKGNEISEAAAVQLLGEAEDNIRYLQTNKFMRERDGKTLEDWQGIVQDLWENNPGLNAAKIRKGVNEFRAIYDELFEQMNDARMRNGYEPINYRKGYFPHFQSNSGDGILAQFGKSLGINTAATQLPTTINGMTHTFKPGIQWFGSAQQRQGVNTSFDAVEGFDAYIEGVADVIHQTDNIQRLRAFATQVRYRTSDEGLRKQVDAVRNDPTIAEEDKQNRIKDIFENGKFELGNFAVEMDEYTNLLAGKKSRHDRDMEQRLGRQMYSIMKALESRVAANMVAINPGSWLTNFIPITQGAATLDSASLLSGMWDTIRAYKQDDGMVASSSFLTNRRGSDPLVRTWAQETSAVLSKPMELIDSFTADTLVRARYNQNIKRGMSESAAIEDADAWAAGVMADRSKGATPTLFSQTNPVTKLFTQFQLEVNNQLSYVFKDIPREMREKGVAALAMAMLKFMIGAYLYDEVYEYLIGRRPALDPLGIINDTVGDLTGYELPNLVELGVGAVKGDMPSFEVEKKGLYDAGVDLATSVAEELPFVGGLLGGGRLPISSALPDVNKLWQAATDDDWDARKRISTAAKELAKPAAYIAPPFGGGQIKKAVEGLAAVARGGSYNVDNKGEDILQYPIHNDTFGQAGLNALSAMFFGKSSSQGGREWVDSGFNSLSAKETALFDSLRDNGAKSKEAYALIRDLQELDTKIDKMVEIGETHFGEFLKELAMSNQMSFSQYEKYMAARAAGVSTEQYTKLLKSISEEAKAQKVDRQDGKPTTSEIETEMWGSDLTPDERRALWDNKGNLADSYKDLLKKYEGETEIGAGSISQSVLKAVLTDSKLTRAQKRAIWNSYGWSTKSPW